MQCDCATPTGTSVVENASSREYSFPGIAAAVQSPSDRGFPFVEENLLLGGQPEHICPGNNLLAFPPCLKQ